MLKAKHTILIFFENVLIVCQLYNFLDQKRLENKKEKFYYPGKEAFFD
jgi:hypothetical protein